MSDSTTFTVTWQIDGEQRTVELFIEWDKEVNQYYVRFEYEYGVSGAHYESFDEAAYWIGHRFFKWGHFIG